MNPIRKTLKLRNVIRSWYWSQRISRQCKSYRSMPRVNFRSKVTNVTRLGHNVNFNGMSIVGSGEVIIGDNFHSGIECRMITQFHRYDDGNSIPYDSSQYISKKIIIEDNVWLGDRVILLGGISIGEGAIIQAGSVVVNNIPKYTIAGGHPAIGFKTRNIAHYERLKKEGKFH